jgi:hypothetical protein
MNIGVVNRRNASNDVDANASDSEMNEETAEVS